MEDFKAMIGLSVSLLDFDMNIWGFTFSFWDILIWSMVAGIILILIWGFFSGK